MFPIFHIFVPVFICELCIRHKKLKNVPIYRFWLIIGAILPDLIDKPLSILFPTIFSGRGVGHAPFVGLILCGLLYFLLKRRELAISLGIGISIHILLDLPGQIPWFWPFVEYPILPADINSYLYTLLHNPLIITTETIGFLGGFVILVKYKILFSRQVIVWDRLQIFLFQNPPKIMWE